MIESSGPLALRRGERLTLRDRDELLAALDRLDQPVPGRAEGRRSDDREQFCITRYLQLVAAGADMRHRLIHDSLEVHLDIVWATDEVDLPSLVQSLDQILREP